MSLKRYLLMQTVWLNALRVANCSLKPLLKWWKWSSTKTHSIRPKVCGHLTISPTSGSCPNCHHKVESTWYFQNVFVCCSLNLNVLHRTLTSTPRSTFGIIWNADDPPGLLTHHQYQRLPILLWLNDTNTHSYIPKPNGKPSQHSGNYSNSKRGTNSMFMPMILKEHR